MTILTAKVASVNLGLLAIQGVMDENGRYYVSVPQICDLFSILIKNATRDIKALLDNTSSVLKLRVVGQQNRNYIVCLTLDDFRRITLKLAIKGNRQAIELAELLLGLALDELFNDAFGISNTPESRQNYMREWQIERQRLRDVHSGMQQAAMRRHHPAALVHDYMTKLICGDTAKEARMKELVDPNADPTIGLNYREEIEDMKKLTKAKVAYAYMKKEAPWQEQVERAVVKQ